MHASVTFMSHVSGKPIGSVPGYVAASVISCRRHDLLQVACWSKLPAWFWEGWDPLLSWPLKPAGSPLVQPLWALSHVPMQPRQQPWCVRLSIQPPDYLQHTDHLTCAAYVTAPLHDIPISQHRLLSKHPPMASASAAACSFLHAELALLCRESDVLPKDHGVNTVKSTGPIAWLPIYTLKPHQLPSFNLCHCLSRPPVKSTEGC